MNEQAAQSFFSVSIGFINGKETISIESFSLFQFLLKPVRKQFPKSQYIASSVTVKTHIVSH